MPAKKAASQKAQSTDMGMNSFWTWVYALGMVVAGVAGGLAFKNDILTWILLLAAVLVGWFYFDPEDIEHFGLRVIILFAVQAALSAVPVVGAFITGFFGGFVFFLFAVTLTMAFHFFWNKRIATLF